MISEKIPFALIDAAARLIDAAEHIVITTHMSPDGDAMGSSHALMHWLQNKGKKAVVVLPNAAPDFLMWMPGADRALLFDKQPVEAEKALAQAGLIICTDFNEPKRNGALGDLLLASQAPKIVIDHHLLAPDNTIDFAEVVMRYPESPSASELVYRVIAQIEKTALPELSMETATCIYTGMMTDTGNFSFNSNFPEMYEIIAHLVDLGVDKDDIYNRVNNAWTADRIKLVGYCLYEKMRIFPASHTALIFLSGKELYKFNFRSGDAEGIVNMPLQIKDIYYSVFMREDKVADWEKEKAGGADKKIKISMRSQGDRPVNIFCHEVFHGGGHKNASGGEHFGSLTEAVKLFLDNYEKYFSKE